MEVTDILQTRAYELIDEEKASVIKNWLDREGLTLIKHSQIKKRKNSMLSHKFKLHHNRIVLSLQHFKLKRKSHESD